MLRRTLLLSFATILAVLSLGSIRGRRRALAYTNCDVSDLSIDTEEQTFLGLINSYRQANGLGTLTMSTNVGRASTWMAIDMGAYNYFAHNDRLGRTFDVRMTNCGSISPSGENIAAGYTTAQDVFTAWKNSPGHNANMLNGAFRQIGIARAYTAGSTYGWYWVTDFSYVDDGTTGGPPAAPTGTISAAPNTCQAAVGNVFCTT